MLVDLDAIPRREPGLEPFEVMISESQERMCAAVLPAKWEEVREVCTRWGLPVAIIGRVTADGDIAIVEGGLDADGRPNPGAVELARIPASALDERCHRPPAHRDARRPTSAPRRLRARRSSRSTACRSGGWTPAPCSWRCSGRRTSRRATRCSTSTTPPSGADTVAGPGRGAAVLRVKGTTKALVATTDGNQAVGVLDPWLGAALSVAEATRNVSITGARPLGVTNCLNYGDPTRPEAFWQLTEGVRGLADACRALGLPVTGGNVSLYNESPTGAIAPTPEIGVVGLLDDVATLVGPAFEQAHDTILLVGEATPGSGRFRVRGLAGAAVEDGPPAPGPGPRGRAPGLHPRGDRARPRRFGAGRLGRRARGRHRRGRDVGRSRRGDPDRRRPLAGGGPVRREPLAPRRDLPARGSRRRSSSWPASTASRSRRSGPSGATGWSSSWPGSAPPDAAEERGSRIADALEVPLADLRHAWEHGLARALGWEG